MRLDQDAGLAHFVFLQLQDRAQRVHLPAHVLHHLVHGIYFDFALLVALQGKAYGHVLGGLHQQGSILLLVLCRLRGQTAQKLLKIQARV